MNARNIVTGIALTLAVTMAGCHHERKISDAENPIASPDDETPARSESINGFDTAYIDTGREIAEMHCAACHNTGPTGVSPRVDAPPLRFVLDNYNPDALANDFRERIHVGHPDMPDFKFSILQIEGLLAYLSTIQEPPETVH